MTPQEIVDFLTPEKIAGAQPKMKFISTQERDDFANIPRFVGSVPEPDGSARHLRTGRSLQPPADVSSADWTFGGTINGAAGRLLIGFGGSVFVCSGTVIDDWGVEGRSMVATAAHCVYDEQTNQFADFYLFIPQQDDGGTDATDFVCENDPFGCWIMQAAVIEQRYFNTPTFAEGIPVDYAILFTPDTGGFHFGGAAGVPDALDQAVKPMKVDFTNKQNIQGGSFGMLMGYPFVADPNFRYCHDDLVEVTFPTGTFLELPACFMGGGSSGGPGLPGPLPGREGDGNLYSVVSYGYVNSVTGEALPGQGGPKLYDNSFSCLYERARIESLDNGENIVVEQTGFCDSDHVGGGNDPHFKTFAGINYDFMGGCDLILLQAPNFATDLAMDIIIRTKVRYEYSYIQDAIIKIGNETFEVGGHGNYILDGVSAAELPNTITGYNITHNLANKKYHTFEIHLDSNESIMVKTFKDWVSISVDNADPKRFKGSRGMVGDFDTRLMLARDGKTALENDPGAFAAEWQVRDDEPMLFHTAQYPQFPDACVIPDTKVLEGRRRRLGESISRDAAEEACGSWEENMKESCIFDGRFRSFCCCLSIFYSK